MIEISKYSFKIGAEKTKFLYISDIHETNIEEAEKIIKNTNADAVFFGGDVLQCKSESKNGLALLKFAAEHKPTFVSIGNHETVDGIDYKSILEKTKAMVIDNDFVEYNGIKIGGLSSGTVKRRFLGRFRKTLPPSTQFIEKFSKIKGPKILLSHHPEYYDEYLKDKDFDLIISGHAHGGQWRIFGQGIFAPGQGIFPKYTSGLYDGKLLVSRGIGNPHKIPRINNKPEILEIEIG